MSRNTHILTAYDKDITELKDKISLISNGLISIIALAKTQVSGKNTAIFEQARNINDNIRSQEIALESLIVSIIALRQPLADDLRFVTSSLKVASLLQSSSNWLVKTIGTIIKLSESLDAETSSTLQQMLDILNEMVKILVWCLLAEGETKDNKLAKLQELETKDTQVDVFYKGLFNNIRNMPIGDFYSFHQLINIAKNIEKAADSINDSARSVKYIITGVQDEIQ